MELMLLLAGLALVAAAVGFVLSTHFHEFHGDNHD